MAPLRQAGKKILLSLAQQVVQPAAERVPTLVFLGPPGVGKGTYSLRIAKQLGLAHISVGDLIRHEIDIGTKPGKAYYSRQKIGVGSIVANFDELMQAAAAVARGDLLSDDIIFDATQSAEFGGDAKVDALQLLENRMNTGREQGEEGFLMDGFPRTAAQAETLVNSADVKAAVNMTLREDVLLQKCLGRRICKRCGANYNVANINLPATETFPLVAMPPLLPKETCKGSLLPKETCKGSLYTRPDDTEETFWHRMEVYRQEAAPVEEVFRRSGLLIDFPVTGGIPETLPKLVKALEPFSFASKECEPLLRRAA